jgi:hypothetical protein
MLTPDMTIRRDVQILVLGTYHFDNPGLDAVRVNVPDHLGAAKQAEIAEVVEALAAFEPTRVAVEHYATKQPDLSAAYAAYRDGRHELHVSEAEQLGFRLARRFDHPDVYGVDDPGSVPMPLDRLVEVAREHDPETLCQLEDAIATAGDRASAALAASTVREALRALNDPREIADGHSFYVWLTKVVHAQDYVGADVLSGWYNRNLRIFANLTRVVGDSDRVLVIFGSGHVAILRDLVQSAPGFSLADPLDYL